MTTADTTGRAGMPGQAGIVLVAVIVILFDDADADRSGQTAW
jgi:hypothetical protein